MKITTQYTNWLGNPRRCGKQVAPPGGQNWNQLKWRHLEKFHLVVVKEFIARQADKSNWNINIVKWSSIITILHSSPYSIQPSGHVNVDTDIFQRCRYRQSIFAIDVSNRATPVSFLKQKCQFFLKKSSFPRDFVISPVSKHFPYARDFVVSPVSSHFWKRLKVWKAGGLQGWKVGWMEGWKARWLEGEKAGRFTDFLSFILFPDTFRKGWKVRTLIFIYYYMMVKCLCVCVQNSSFWAECRSEKCTHKRLTFF